MSALVLALAGTDHHPFDRLVRWMDAAAASRDDVRVVVQHGWSSAPHVAAGERFLAHDELVSLVAEAAVVVCHGGPGTIMDARAAGHVPLCVPRDPRLGEHVDGHQQRFVAVVGEVGLVRAVPTLHDLLGGIECALSMPPSSLAAGVADGIRQSALALAAAELEHVGSHRPPRFGRRHRTALLAH